MGKGELERISGGGRASMKTINRLPATSDNIGHTASLHFAQILLRRPSDTLGTLDEIFKSKFIRRVRGEYDGESEKAEC